METRTLKEDRFHPVQLRVFFTMVALYTFYFTCNNNLGVATAEIQNDLQIDNTEFGILFTVWTFGFGAGQFFSGYLGDRYSPRMLMFIGAIGASAANICFAFSSDMKLFVLFWAINAVSLAMGWSPGCSILFKWIPQKKWGLFMGIFDAFAFLGGIIVFPLAGFAISYMNWQSAFFIPATLLIIWSVVFLIFVKDRPEQLGFKVEWDNGNGDDGNVTIKDYAEVFRNRAIILVSLSTVCSQFVRWGLVNWIIKILTTSQDEGGYGIILITATVIASAMHWGGAIFSILLGHMSDTVFGGKRWQTIFTGFAISTVSLGILYAAGSSLLMIPGGIIVLAVLLFLAGGCIQGVQAPLFNLPGDILGTRLGGTGVGIVNGWSYMGASFAGVLLGFFMDNISLMSCILLMAFISAAGALIILAVKR